MASNLFRRGNRTFVVASIITMGVGILHATGLANDPPTDKYAAAIQAMRTASLGIGPFEMTLYGTYESVWIQVGVFLVLLGAKNLLVAGIASSNDLAKLVRVLSAADCGVYIAFTAMFVYYQIPPPLLIYTILATLFLASAIFAGKQTATN